jgi:hypothetical protein
MTHAMCMYFEIIKKRWTGPTDGSTAKESNERRK